MTMDSFIEKNVLKSGKGSREAHLVKLLSVQGLMTAQLEFAVTKRG